MTSLGYSLVAEEHGPNDLVDYAVHAEEAGFEFALASDHFHPWLSSQGNAPFVWSTLGGVARETETLEVGTGVTCPLIRTHPAIIAQAAATVGAMMPGRFFLGVGTGENLNEHVLGDRWPPHDVRLEMLEEAVHVIRRLWEGETTSHHGKYYTVENARIYTLPEELPPIHVAAAGPQTTAVASDIGDGLVATSANEKSVEAFRDGDDERPRYGQVTVCWAEDEEEAERIAYEQWANTAVGGELGQVLPTPAHFEQAVQMLDVEDVAEKVVCGNDPADHVEKIREFTDAGFDHVSVHNVGPNQEECIEFYADEVFPAFD